MTKVICPEPGSQLTIGSVTAPMTEPTPRTDALVQALGIKHFRGDLPISAFGCEMESKGVGKCMSWCGNFSCPKTSNTPHPAFGESWEYPTIRKLIAEYESLERSLARKEALLRRVDDAFGRTEVDAALVIALGYGPACDLREAVRIERELEGK
jgi:hypothetical protein